MLNEVGGGGRARWLPDLENRRYFLPPMRWTSWGRATLSDLQFNRGYKKNKENQYNTDFKKWLKQTKDDITETKKI
jgi:hypothetical protein